MIRPIPLSALLDHASLADVRRVAGAADPAVSGVRGVRMDAPADDATAGVSGGSSSGAGDVLVVLDRAERTTWRFDARLRRLADRGVAAVVLDAAVAVDPATTLLADRLGIVVLTCDDAWATSVALHDRLGDARAAAGRAALDAVSAVADAGRDPADALRAAAAMLGRPALLVDSSGRVLAPEGSALSPAAHAAVAAGLAGHVDARPVGERGTLVTAPVDSGLMAPSWLVVEVPGSVVAEVEAVAAALPVVALAVGHRLSLRRVVDEREARWRIALLGELLEAGDSPGAGLLRRALELGWRVEGWHMGIRVVSRQDADIVGRRYELIEALAAEGLDVGVVEQGDGWAAWISFALEPDVPTAHDAARAVRRAQQRWDDDLPSDVGVGRVHRGPAGIARSLAEAADAARLAASRPQSGRFLHVDRLGLAQLLLAWTQTDTFQPAALELLAPLRRQTTGDLLATLATYLDAESSVAETASILAVHRNTVAERIQRVQRILQVDLADAETRLALHLACRTVLAAEG
ncbi:PucR family transcriptional regulator [Clavibacter michiganensis]|uniref:PucR family transcriptional regulator n=1 Tax=Clavibacter michiganensis TaxID=28447 RepID=UPI0026DB500C|nr:helix-turn-helix domain-containing protein [Clavibacter michiganensis]MDO4028223.1 helix-turn-helix domain-containing protein [Clavibacter michiganensis]